MDNVVEASNILMNQQNPIARRTRALFYLKNSNTSQSTTILMNALNDSSVLLKHEICYILGQMLNLDCITTLRNTILNLDEDEIVRHEAGEALGNYHTESDFLEQFLGDKSRSVVETCYLAVCKAKEFKNLQTNIYSSMNKEINMDKCMNNENTEGNQIELISPFGSVDPAFPYIGMDLTELEEIYLNATCIYLQYKSMFSLRNINTEQAVHILGKGMKHKSALFRHEVAFVFGQMKKKESLQYLVERLNDKDEHEMVRHECAEAIGAIGCVDGLKLLDSYKNDPSVIVRESVEVAMDINEYMIGDELEYAK